VPPLAQAPTERHTARHGARREVDHDPGVSATVSTLIITLGVGTSLKARLTIIAYLNLARQQPMLLIFGLGRYGLASVVLSAGGQNGTCAQRKSLTANAASMSGIRTAMLRR
jgi:hypothetical protein